MKTNLSRVFVLCCTLLISAFASAYDFEIDGIAYNIIDATAKTVEVTHKVDESALSHPRTDYTGDIVIPSEVTNNGTTYDVVAIDRNAFHRCTQLISVSSTSVTSVGEDAFSHCYSLVSASLPKATVIGGSAFYVDSNLASLDLSAAQAIGGDAFHNCGNIKTLRIGSAAQWCGIDFANNGANPIYASSRERTSGNEVTLYVGNETTPVTELSDEGVTSVPDFAFNKIFSLKSVSFPNATTIGERSFYGCVALETIELPKTTSVGMEAFFLCKSLTALDLPSAITIGRESFKGCASLLSISLPKAKTIKYEAFCYEVQDWNWEFGNGVDQSWFVCDKVEYLDLSSVETIEASAFRGLNGLKRLRVGSLGQWWNVTFGDNDSHPMLVSQQKTTLYLGNDNQPVTIISDETITRVPDYAMPNNESLVRLHLPNVTSVGVSAFEGCTALTSFNFPKAQSIDANAFRACTALPNLEFPEVLTVGEYAFAGCERLLSVRLPKATTIGTRAFGHFEFWQGERSQNLYCANLKTVEIPSAVHIGEQAFYDCESLQELYLSAYSPLSFGENIVSPWTMITVPSALYEKYLAMPNLSDMELQIAKKEYASQILTVNAQDNTSSLLTLVGEDNARHVVTLKVSGTINSYDMMVMRNKMPGLRTLDISEATIVKNKYEYYEGHGSQDNIVGSEWFKDKPIIYVNLPKNTKRVGARAFLRCPYLIEAKVHEGLKAIEESAFSECPRLHEAIIPNTVDSIYIFAFSDSHNVGTITLGKNLTFIGQEAFRGCNKVKKVDLPTYLQTIDWGAFSGCTNLEEVLIPSSITRINNRAFADCPKLKTVVATTVEPVGINQETFSNWQLASLYVPRTSYYTYYWNTQWSQFLKVREYSELTGVPFRYEYFYINKDFVLNEENGRFEGNPDADLNEESGLIVDGGDVQELGTVHIKHSGNSGASLIGRGTGTVHMDKLVVDILVDGGRWYFFTFPFDITSANMEFPSSHVWYKYDGEERAKGNSGWVKVATNETLTASNGYIFQGSASGCLSLSIEDLTIGAQDMQTSMTSYPSANTQDDSWNLIGNPCTSYFDIDNTGYEAPITIYNPETGQYEAVRPGDDDYSFYPFQAFFVQKPEGIDEIVYDSDLCETKTESENSIELKAARRKARGVNANTPRKLINLKLTSGAMSDKTRIVINPEKSMDYELDCDAAKFIDASMPQIYSLDSRGTKYAINERPKDNGIIPLVVNAPTEGEYTIEITRADCPVILRDQTLGKEVNIVEESYSFALEAGATVGRFDIVVGAEATAIKNVEAMNELVSVKNGTICINNTSADVTVYDVNGTTVARQKGSGIIEVSAGTYIVKIGEKIQKVIVK